mgnify:CR=1 FL=1
MASKHTGQRDLFEQAYIESLIRSGARDRAAHVLRERLARRGGHNLFAGRRLARLDTTRTGLAALALAAAAGVAVENARLHHQIRQPFLNPRRHLKVELQPADSLGIIRIDAAQLLQRSFLLGV